MTTENLWQIVAGARNGILATISEDGTPQLSNIYYLSDPSTRLVRFSTTTVRIKGHNLLRDPRAALHVPARTSSTSRSWQDLPLWRSPESPTDHAVEKLFEIHAGLGAASNRDGFGEKMLADHRMAVELHVERIYGQILDR